ncbi:lipase family alpha/beta hydrolase [Litorivivens sp.]|uniref:lipase family alpha/beta hydrolase n=1 Tax=Litorivivens sp. TaxID=2020868 RepID=UPI00356639E6
MSARNASAAKPNLLLALTEGPRTLLDVSVLCSWRWLPQQFLRGDGHGVLVIPGFLGGDGYNRMLTNFLCGLGYQAVGWGQGRNLGPRAELLDGMAQQVERLVEKTQGKISIVGHSLGGVYAREIARERPEFVRQVISLGSPINDDGRATTPSARLFRLLNGEPDTESSLRSTAPPVPITSVYTKADGVVAWQQALQYAGHEHCENIEVPGSHCGLTWNLSVNHLLADRLSQNDGEWRPFVRPEKFRFLFPDNRRDLQMLGLGG